MKHNVFYFVLATLSCLAISSCDKGEDLTRLPQDKLTLEAYFKNESQCAMWFNSCYDEYLPEFTIIRDNADDMLDKDMGACIFMGARTITNSGSWQWDNLRHINEFFQYCDNCTDEAVLKKYIGIASFFRAFEYFNKVKDYGDVPYYDTPIGSSDKELLQKSRDSRVFVLEKVLEDLDVAIANLPSGKSVSELTKWTALALKSRVALYEGTWEKYHPGYGAHSSEFKAEYFLQKAAEAAQELIDNGGYSLYSNGNTPYFDLFASLDAIPEEVILARVYKYEGLSLGHKANYYIRNEQMGFTRRFMNHYLNADGSRHQVNDSAAYLDEVSGRDPRLAQTVLCPGFIMPGSTDVTANDLSSCTGYSPVKFFSEAYNGDENKCENDLPCFRYAEVLLNYAEALAELGTITQGDLDKSVNVIRARAKMPAMILNTVASNIDPFLAACYPNAKSGVVLEIRRERTVELVMEGFRMDDMLRWGEGAQLSPSNSPWTGVYVQGPGLYDMDNDGIKELEIYTDKASHKVGDGSGVINFYQIGSTSTLTEGTYGNMTPKISVSYVWDESKDYLWPIPSRQLTLNPNLGQNPGWE